MADDREPIQQQVGEQWLQRVGPTRQRRRDRGRSLARKGAVERLSLEPGSATGRVRHGRGKPKDVTLDVPTFGDPRWRELIDAMADEVRYTAALMTGELPTELVDLAHRHGLELLPEREEVGADCSCMEPDQPCLHVAALHGAVADALRDDPSLLLRLRGRDRTWLLDRLRDLRGEGPEAEPGVLEGVEDPYAARGDLESIVVHPQPVEDPASLFEQLGTPPGVDDPGRFTRLIGQTAGTAWRLASGAGQQVADEEVLLAELRAQRFGSAASVADGLGWDEEQTREMLDRLFEDGTVLRTGSGDSARYRAASSA